MRFGSEPTSPISSPGESGERVKCSQCGMWNWSTAVYCVSCRAPQDEGEAAQPDDLPSQAESLEALLGRQSEKAEGSEESETATPEADEPEAVEPEADEPEAVEPEADEPEAVEIPAVVPATVASEPAVVVPERAPRTGEPHAEAAEALAAAFDRATARSKTEVVALAGPREAGKDDVLRAFVQGLVGRSTVLFTRFQRLQGTGLVSTWPIADLLEQGIGITGDDAEEARRKVEAFFADLPPLAPDWVMGALGLPGAPAANPAESERAFRQFLTTLSWKGPLTIVIDDCDRADHAFMRFLTAAASRASGAAILIVLASESVPQSLSVAGLGFEIVGVDPLPEEHLALGLPDLPTGYTIDPAASGPIAAVADGDVFLAEQTLVMQLDAHAYDIDGDRVTLTLSPALTTFPDREEVLDACLKRMPAADKALLEAAAVGGTSFSADDVVAVVPDRDRAGALATLRGFVASGLLAEEPAGVPDLFTFRALSLWDACDTRGRPETNAKLHESWASWLENAAPSRPARYSERIGRHLAAAWDIRTKAGDRRVSMLTLAERAADALERAAVPAADVGDTGTARALYERAASVLPRTDARRARDVLEAGKLLERDGDLRVRSVASQAEYLARTAGAEAEGCRAEVLIASLLVSADADSDALDQALSVADAAVRVLEAIGDDQGLAEAWSLRGSVSRARGHMAGSAASFAAATQYAQRAGSQRMEIECQRAFGWAIANGPSAVPATIRRLAEVSAHVGSDRIAHQDLQGLVAIQMAKGGEPDEARVLTRSLVDVLEDIGLTEEIAAGLRAAGIVEMLAGDFPAAEGFFTRALSSARAPRSRSRIAASFIHVWAALGDKERAQEMCDVAGRDTARDDVLTRVIWMSGDAKVMALDGRYLQADIRAREAVKLAEQTDAEILRAEALMDLGRVLSVGGRQFEALPILSKALRTFERKGATAYLDEARKMLAS